MNQSYHHKIPSISILHLWFVPDDFVVAAQKLIFLEHGDEPLPDSTVLADVGIENESMLTLIMETRASLPSVLVSRFFIHHA